MRAIRMSNTGGPEVMILEEVDDPTPAANGIVVQVGAAGVNYIDTYHRSGLYTMPLPLTPGLEGSGTVTAVGADVTQWKEGDKVAWTGAIGSYAEKVAMPAASAGRCARRRQRRCRRRIDAARADLALSRR